MRVSWLLGAVVFLWIVDRWKRRLHYDPVTGRSWASRWIRLGRDVRYRLRGGLRKHLPIWLVPGFLRIGGRREQLRPSLSWPLRDAFRRHDELHGGAGRRVGRYRLFQSHEQLRIVLGFRRHLQSLAFYSGDTLVATVTGADVDPPMTANGGQTDYASNGYVLISALPQFDRVVAASSSNSFEFDNVVAAAAPGFPTASAAVPEPSTWAMLLLGFSGPGYAAFRRSKGPISVVA